MGGAEKLIIETLPLFNKKGISTDLLLLNGSETKLHSLLIKDASFNIYSLGNGWIYNPIFIFKLFVYLKRYDIVHVHLFPSMYYAAIAKWLSRSKTTLVFTEHSTSNRRLANPIFSILEKWIYRKYQKIICISAAVKSSVIAALKIGSDKFVVVENGVNIDSIKTFAPANRSLFQLDDKDFVLTMVAGFRAEKDQSTVLKAIPYLPSDCKVLFVGDGDTRDKCIELAHKLGVEERVRFLGIRTDAISIMKMSDVNLLSSHWEGFGLVAIEGMATERPFIASNVPGLADVVGNAGVTFEKGDVYELSKLIRRLKDEPSFYDYVAKRCADRAQQYDINTMISRSIDIYSELQQTAKHN